MFWVIDYGCLAVILACAVLVTRLRNLSGAVIALSAAGTMTAVLFVVLGAPDDAHSEVVVGAIALPTMYFVALSKIHTALGRRGNTGEEEDGEKS